MKRDQAYIDARKQYYIEQREIYAAKDPKEHAQCMFAELSTTEDRNMYGDTLAFVLHGRELQDLEYTSRVVTELFALFREANMLPADLSQGCLDTEYKQYLKETFGYTYYVVCTDEHWGCEDTFMSLFNTLNYRWLQMHGSYVPNLRTFEFYKEQGLEP